MKRKKSYCTPSVVTNFPESRKSPNEYEAPQTQNRAIMWQFGIIKAHSHKKNELRGVRNKKVRCGGIFFVYATGFFCFYATHAHQTQRQWAALIESSPKPVSELLGRFSK